MSQDFYSKLETLLKKNSRFVDQEGDLLKSNVIDCAYKADKKLIELLLENKEVKNKFFSKIKSPSNPPFSKGEDYWVFNIDDFVFYIQDKNFLADSYTKYRNKIGFNIDGKFLNERKEVALVWPFKDCVLEGGMTKEDEKRKEIFFNEILAQDEIDKLLAPKVLINWKRYTADGETSLTPLIRGESSCCPPDKGGWGVLRRDENGVLRENLIIKGNNLLALHSLKQQFQNKIKLIYIDPPYNTGNDSFGYNDNFNHSTWLTFMKNRLEVARGLLREDGSIWINIDDGESHYLKVLCDEVFGRENFVANIVWQKKYSPQNDAKYFSDNHDHILVFAKKKENWKPNLLPRTEEMDARYKNPDNDPRGIWKTSDLSAKRVTLKDIYEIITPSGRKVMPPRGRSWVVSKSKFKELLKNNRIWFGENGNSIPQLKRFLSDVQEGFVPMTIWSYEEVGHNQEAKQEVNKMLNNELFSTPKPERLIQRILQIGSNKNDIVLDFFAGSGTTGAVAMKMKRQFILTEQMDYIEKVTVERLKKVIGKKIKKSGKLLDEIDFDIGGISKAVNWKGGGDFIYCELMEYNEQFVEKIKKAKDIKELLKIWGEMKKKSFLNYNVDIKKFDETIDEFKKLSLAKQQRILFDFLNKNQLYVGLSEIEDVEFEVEEGDKKLNGEFYK